MPGPCINIVHLSDLQAGKACLASLKTHGFTKLSLAKRYEYYADGIAADAFRTLKAFRRPSRVDLLVLTGDVTHYAQPNEYKMASAFLKRLRAGLKVKCQNVAIVPGNHDVDWTRLSTKYGKKAPTRPAGLVQCAADPEKMASFRNWFNRIYQKPEVPYRYHFGQPVFFNRVTRRRQLCVIGLDSCERLTHNQRENHGYISQDQLQLAVERFQQEGPHKVKIALMHHNPFPHEEDDNPTGLKEPDRIRKGLEAAGVNLILAGHMHRARYELHTGDADQFCHIFIAGPCCMRHEYRQFPVGPKGYTKEKADPDKMEVFPNRYQLISINTSSYGAEVFLRRFSFERRMEVGTRGDWTADNDPGYTSMMGTVGVSLDPTGTKAKALRDKKLRSKQTTTEVPETS